MTECGWGGGGSDDGCSGNSGDGISMAVASDGEVVLGELYLERR